MARRRKKTTTADLIFPLVFLAVFLLWRGGDVAASFVEVAVKMLLLAVIAFGGCYVTWRFLCKPVLARYFNKPTQPSITRTASFKPPVTAKNDSGSIFDKVDQPITSHSKSPVDEPLSLSIESLREMDWKRFELLCQGYYQTQGYQARLTSHGADGGVDIILEKDLPEGEKQKVYVQCKAWSSQSVGVKPVRELYGVMASDGVSEGIFVTSSSFTPDAKSFSSGKNLKLLTGGYLLDAILMLPCEQREALIKKALEGDYKTPTCPSCDIKMMLPTSQKGRNIGEQFWGCRNFPRCRQNLQVKSKLKSKPRYF